MTALAINRPQRRGACPGLSVPMPTGDGSLVRLLPIGTVPLATFSKLCAEARRDGNGVIEITGRGSVQVRGLTAASAPRFADAIAALNIAAEDGIPVLSNALAGIDAEEILDASALAADLRRALARTSLSARLAPKVSIAIDGGGALKLDGVAADVRLCAELSNGSPVLRVSVGGDGLSAPQFGVAEPTHGVEIAMRLLEVVAQRGRDARARDILAAEGVAPFSAALGSGAGSCVLPPAPRKWEKSDAIGVHALRDGSLACGIGLAFGHADASALERLAQAAAAAGATGLRAAAGRALMTVGLTRDTATAFVAAAENLGFIVSANDPRRHVVACAGAPICSSAFIAARGIAPLVADVAGPYLDGAFQIHISGCAKGCAYTGTAALTVVGSPAGCALLAAGSARDTPFSVIATDELPTAIARYAREAKREGGHV
jgi:precorrin-3B synthase